MDNIKFSSFENICRTCMYTSDLSPIPDNNIKDVLQFLSGIKYSKTDELPQKLCLKCFETINDIQLFAFKCQQTHLTFKNCLIEFKNNQNYETEFVGIKQEIPDIDRNNLELITIKEENNRISSNLSTSDISQTNEQKQTQHTTKQGKCIYKCEVCNKTFKTNNILSHHSKLHNNNRKYECNICLKRFQRSSHLTRHKIIHSTERPYKCEVCSKTFTTKYGSDKHKNIHTDERRFECSVCMKSFKISGDLIRHKRIHSGERPYQCEVCNKAFSQKCNLVKHMTTHTDERRFECDICREVFKYSCNLTRHKKIHSGEGLYQCEVCNKTFSRKSYLTSHKVTHSGEG